MWTEASRRVHIGPGHERRGGGWGERNRREKGTSDYQKV